MAHQIQNPRYQRQTALRELGESGQEKLSKAKVLVIGAGGLGCPALQYLVGAGLGTIGIVDHDTVALNNLHRQVLYSTDDVGISKALRAADILTALNPEIDIVAFNEMLDPKNSIRIISQFDIILDGTDNFASRYMINDACVLTRKTLVYGAISRFEGQLAVFNFSGNVGPASANYRDLFPDPPSESEVLNCAETGVIGVLPGIIGTMMANEAIKLITGMGSNLINRILTFNAFSNQFYELEIMPKAVTRSLIPVDFVAFQKTDYEFLCASKAGNEIDVNLFEEMLQDPSALFIDVREADEVPTVNEFANLRLPLSNFRNTLAKIKKDNVVLFCQTGKRSANAARIVMDHFGKSKNVYSLKGGIEAWKNARKE